MAYKKQNHRLNSASGYIDVRTIARPKQVQPVPHVGDKIIITELMPRVKDFGILRKEHGAFEVCYYTPNLVIGYHLNQNLERVYETSYRITDFLYGIMVYSVLVDAFSETDELIDPTENLNLMMQ